MFVEHNRAGILALEHSIIGKEKKHNLHVSNSNPDVSPHWSLMLVITEKIQMLKTHILTLLAQHLFMFLKMK